MELSTRDSLAMANPVKPATDLGLSREPEPLAAQADLLLLVVDMLRSPSTQIQRPFEAWFNVPIEEINKLIDLAFQQPTESQGLEQFDTTDCIQASAWQGNSPEAISSLKQAFEKARSLAKDLPSQLWSDEYCRLFESSQACPPNEASYIRRDKGSILGDLAGFYSAFGWKGNPKNGERLDHLRTELEFVGLMLAMAAQASDRTQQSTVLDGLEKFTNLHLNDWLPSVCFQLIQAASLEYFAVVSDCLLALWQALTLENAWPVDPLPQTPLTPTVDPQDPYECGAPDLVNIEVNSTH